MMELLPEIETYLARTGLAASRFGRLAVGDPRFVADLKGGRKLRPKTHERVVRYLTVSLSAGCLDEAANQTPPT